MQSKAAPSTLVVTNILRNTYYAGDASFEELGPVKAKNMPNVMVWKKAY